MMKVQASLLAAIMLVGSSSAQVDSLRSGTEIKFKSVQFSGWQQGQFNRLSEDGTQLIYSPGTGDAIVDVRMDDLVRLKYNAGSRDRDLAGMLTGVAVGATLGASITGRDEPYTNEVVLCNGEPFFLFCNKKITRHTYSGVIKGQPWKGAIRGAVIGFLAGTFVGMKLKTTVWQDVDLSLRVDQGPGAGNAVGLDLRVDLTP